MLAGEEHITHEAEEAGATTPPQVKKQLNVLHLMPNLLEGMNDLEFSVSVSQSGLCFFLTQGLLKLYDFLRESGDIACGCIQPRPPPNLD